MRKFTFFSFMAMLFCQVVSAQKVGIGTNDPKARLALNGGLVIDQGDLNQGVLDANNTNALFFGGDMKTGILNNRTAGSVSRSALGFVTSGIRRMIIDSLGRVAIGLNPNPNYNLAVGGRTYLTDAVVGNSMEVSG